MRRLAFLQWVPKATVPHLHRYYQGAPTPDPASLGLIVSPSGTVRACWGSFPLLTLPASCRPDAGPGSGLISLAFPLQPDPYTDGTGPPRFPGGPSTALQRSRDPGRPVTPRHGGVSGAAPASTTTKAPSLAISRLNSAASLPAVYASRRTLPYAMQHALPAGWLAFAGRGSHPLDRDVGFQFRLTSLPPPIQSLAWRNVNLPWRRFWVSCCEGLLG